MTPICWELMKEGTKIGEENECCEMDMYGVRV